MHSSILQYSILLCVGIVTSDPSPGRIPKVYNALITSNQNLEPSKAFPVYQPVIHDAAFTFPLQSPFFYGHELPLGNGLIPAPAFLPRGPNAIPEPAPGPSSKAPEAAGSPSSTEQPESSASSVAPPTEIPSNSEQAAPSESSTSLPNSADQAAQSPPPPPSTESPIPLNQFGLPPQVLPISHTYNTIPNIRHFTYSYPAFRFYDPFDPFGFNPYAGLPPLYHPLTNVLGQYEASPSGREQIPNSVGSNPSTPSPPPEPSDLNVLNYSPKDPEIANVPPPPLPQGGLKPDKPE
ncbi:PREDICTED: extensin [Papilio polytes]|uniref:extensin n=1 Tax=Papilio polytes TaxID=76194 RepID=UPI000675EC5E|nr:PREDICTED: extensin [Papilio polytes]